MRLLLVLLFFGVTAFQCKKGNSIGVVPVQVSVTDVSQKRIPLFIDRDNSEIINLRLSVVAESGPIQLTGVKLKLAAGSTTQALAAVKLKYSGLTQGSGTNVPFGTGSAVSDGYTFSGNQEMTSGSHILKFDFSLKPDADLKTSFTVESIELTFKGQSAITAKPSDKFAFRPALVVRAQGEDNVNTYRIPGLTTTNKGTLIAVYDKRYLGSGDLQGDIDVGMSRSTDGGQTWSAMKTVLDMGEYNGLPQNQNGIGDPSVLTDQATNTIWVAGLWVSGIPGQTAWYGSKPGLKPGETGQFVLVKSEDDGVTWSQPINITEQCKRVEWNLFFQGPGKGITMTDGTLVFPAQFKDAQAVPWSTIVYSSDHGKTWSVGTGAKSNTTESQVVQLSDGSLMLNMRDDRNKTEKGDKNGRAVSITKDMGQTWSVHPSSNSALPESNCQASLITAKILINGIPKDVLFFSNPNDKYSRAHMTIKASLNQGLTWPTEYQVELNSDDSYGYSCLTMVDGKTLGILYEGTKELYFQKISVAELLGNLIK
ncbi:MAG: exo-alpha-sialidase [Bacteroidetes bacterium]|nr:exo-alpha-sialidase [Bacteroidota bacterium]